MDGYLIDDLARHIGQTVTIYTTSGGLSGGGFTGVILSVDPRVVRILCDEGAPPACPVGSACDCNFNPYGMQGSYGYGGGYGYGGCDGGCGCGYGGGFGGKGFGFGCGGFNPLGSVTVIPIQAIAAFSHHAI